MVIMCQGFQSFLKGCLHHLVLAKLATSSKRVKLDQCTFLKECCESDIYGRLKGKVIKELGRPCNIFQFGGDG